MESGLLTQVVLPLCLFIIMMGMGFSLVPADFGRVLIYPKAVILGLLGQLLVLPVFGFFIAAFLVEDPALAVGVMLLAACPGGTTSNMVTHLAKGDLALSITLTAVSSLFTFVTIPLILGFSLDYFYASDEIIDLPVLRTMGTLFLITLLPVSVGMLIRHYATRFALRLEPYLNQFALIFLVFLIISVCIQQREILGAAIQTAGPATLLLNVSTMVFGYWLARTYRLNTAQTTSISLEIGIQNSALAMLIATTLLDNPTMALPPGIYSLVMYLTGGFVVGLRHRQRTTGKIVLKPADQQE